MLANGCQMDLDKGQRGTPLSMSKGDNQIERFETYKHRFQVLNSIWLENNSAYKTAHSFRLLKTFCLSVHHHVPFLLTDGDVVPDSKLEFSIWK